MKKIFCIILFSLLMFTNIVPVIAADDSNGTNTVVTIGADNNSSQRNTIYQIFDVDPDDPDIKFLEVTNTQEREYLEGIADEKQIGTKAISCVYVRILSEGDGIDVKTKNITWVTKESYANALVTAGIENAEIYAAAAFPVSGTAALTGLFIAYEEATGEEIPQEAKEVATEELITAGSIGEETGEKGKVDELIKEVKEDVIRQGLEDPDKIKDVIKKKADELDLKLTDEQIDKIVQLMTKISKLDINVDQLREQLKNIGSKIKDVLDSEEGKGFWQSIKNVWNNFIDWISNLFS